MFRSASARASAHLRTERQSLSLDDRQYIIRSRDGDYFLGWESTSWETVKGFALWTKSKIAAARFTLRDLPKVGYMDLVCGFSGLTLERVK